MTPRIPGSCRRALPSARRPAKAPDAFRYFAGWDADPSTGPSTTIRATPPGAQPRRSMRGADRCEPYLGSQPAIAVKLPRRLGHPQNVDPRGATSSPVHSRGFPKGAGLIGVAGWLRDAPRHRATGAPASSVGGDPPATVCDEQDGGSLPPTSKSPYANRPAQPYRDTSLEGVGTTIHPRVQRRLRARRVPGPRAGSAHIEGDQHRPTQQRHETRVGQTAGHQ